MHCWQAKPLQRRTLIAVLLSIGFLSSCSSRRQREIVVAPLFELKDLSGHTVRLDSFRGHPVLLDFWATWCGPCRMSIPMVIDFYDRHKAEGLVVLGLNIDDNPSGVYGFVKKFNMPYPVLLAGSSAAAQDYEVDGIPHFVFVNPEGQIVQTYSGFSPEMAQSWESELASMQKTSP